MMPQRKKELKKKIEPYKTFLPLLTVWRNKLDRWKFKCKYFFATVWPYSQYFIFFELTNGRNKPERYNTLGRNAF